MCITRYTHRVLLPTVLSHGQEREGRPVLVSHRHASPGSGGDALLSGRVVAEVNLLSVTFFSQRDGWTAVVAMGILLPFGGCV